MSKIYEALRRAEQDRATQDTGKPESTEAAPPPVAAPVATPPPQAPQPIAPAPIAAAHAAPPPVAPSPSMASMLEQAIPARPIVNDPWATPEYQPPAESAVFSPSSVPAEPVELASISAHPWNPSYHHLPALEARGRAVEQFRSLRSRMHEFRDLNTLKSILVSSALPQEGKTFIAANLAISFARHKAARVLLIDGDMRRSSLHHLFGCPQEPGLTDYLSGNAEVMDILQRPQAAEGGNLHHGLESLTFISAGKDSDKAADLSGNHRFEELIRNVSPMFDWIVIDSSPVNLVADGVNLSRACDGVLLVARAGLTKFEVAQRSLTELKAANVLGFVLNAVVRPPSSGGYYGYDGYDSYDSLEA